MGATIRGLLVVLLLLKSAAALAEDCKVPTFNFVPSGVAQAIMYVRQNAACDFHFQATNGDRGVFGILSSVVTVQPKNGILGKMNVRHYAYKPNPGFTGDDAFEIKITYDHNHEDLVTTVQMTVHAGTGGLSW
jgi:hypothetical protein